MATPKPTPKKAAEPKRLDALFVRSLAPRFRRAGFEFTREGVGLRLDDLSEEQLEAIEREPLLSVQYCEFPTMDDLCAEVVEKAAKGAKDPANTEADA